VDKHKEAPIQAVSALKLTYGKRGVPGAGADFFTLEPLIFNAQTAFARKMSSFFKKALATPSP
jgi:hypothetical protein